jgi:hypothetical protein
VFHVQLHDISEKSAHHPGRLGAHGTRLGNIHGVFTEVGHTQIFQQ